MQVCVGNSCWRRPHQPVHWAANRGGQAAKSLHYSRVGIEDGRGASEAGIAQVQTSVVYFSLVKSPPGTRPGNAAPEWEVYTERTDEVCNRPTSGAVRLRRTDIDIVTIVKTSIHH